MSNINIENVRELTELMTLHNLNEIKLESDEIKISLKRNCNDATPSVQVIPQVIQPQLAAAPAPVAAPVTAPAAPAPEATPAAVATESIESPLVGTFYSKPSPTAEPFVTVGSVVNENTIVCIVEAMKVMNEIKAEKSGKIAKINCTDGSPVQYGQALFEIEPL